MKKEKRKSSLEARRRGEEEASSKIHIMQRLLNTSYYAVDKTY